MRPLPDLSNTAPMPRLSTIDPELLAQFNAGIERAAAADRRVQASRERHAAEKKKPTK